MFKKLFFIILLLKSNAQESPCFSQQEYESAYNEALCSYNTLESDLLEGVLSGKYGISKTNPIYDHFKSLHIDYEILAHNKFATVSNIALKWLRSKQNYTRAQFKLCLSKIVTSNFCTPLQSNCSISDTNYYRTDGWCNNPLDPSKGAKGTPLIRLVEDRFVDDIDTPDPNRISSPKELSKIGNDNKGGFDSGRQPGINNDLSVIVWQIMTHVFMKTKMPQYSTEGDLPGFNCCALKNDTDHAELIKRNPECFAIPISKPDPCYNGTVDCLHYSKVMHAYQQCRITSPSAPINLSPAYLGLELLYNGYTLKHLSENNGFFDIENHLKMKEMLLAYDERSGQLPGLFLFLIIFAELHNFVAADFMTLQPSLKTQQLILEARKATTGAFQKIMIDTVRSVIRDFRFPGNCYDPTIDPQVSIEFTIALRFFHYFIRDNWGMYPAETFRQVNGLRGVLVENIEMSKTFDFWDLYLSNRCGLTHGHLDTSWNMFSLGPYNQCNFFAKKSDEFGIDLRAYDIAYGQIVGEPSFCDVLKFFNKSTTDCAKLIEDNIDRRFINILKEKFGNDISKIGLTAGLDVEHRPEAIGHATVKIIKEQFHRTVCGDRFWYNHDSTNIFTKSQRDAINQFSFRSLLCMFNNCNTTRIQLDPFLSPGFMNGKFLCDPNVHKFNTKTWFD